MIGIKRLTVQGSEFKTDYSKPVRIDARGIYYQQLNEMVRRAAANGARKIILDNVNGQRYIGTGVKGNDATIIINGTPGNDLAAFMNGPTVIVNGDAQDGVGNTMNDGKVVIHGNAGDVIGYGMRGGRIFIKGDVGYRVGIHMKSYKNQVPVIIAGGTAGDFLGEYMAGGILILLGLNRKEHGDYLGTGMHGGVMYIRAEVDPFRCGAEVGIAELYDEDKETLKKYLNEFCDDFSLDFNEIMKERFVKLYPKSSRPYGRLYAY